MSADVATVKAHSEKDEKDFDKVFTYLSQYVEKHGPKMSIKVASLAQGRPTR